MNSNHRQRATRDMAVITGASSGIGLQFAHVLAELGYDLALVARREAQLQQIAQSLRAAHQIDVWPIVEDLSTHDGPERVVSALDRIDRKVSCLINNAGSGITETFLGTPWPVHQAMMGLMMQAPMRLSYLLLPRILETADPRLINVGSVSAFMPAIYGTGVYVGAKAFLLRMTELFAAEHGSGGLRATCVCPGVTDTEIFEQSGADKTKIPGVMMSPRYVAQSAWTANSRGDVSFVPGLKNNWLAWLGRVLPQAMLRRKMGEFVCKPNRHKKPT